MSALIRVTLIMAAIGYALSVAVYFAAGLHSAAAMIACDLVPWFAVRHPNWRP